MLFNMVLPGAVETARLPKEYQEVEYIQSSGTQYIDTGFVPSYSTRVVMRAIVQDYSANGAFFGARTSSSLSGLSFSLMLLSGGTVRSDYYGTEVNVTTVPLGEEIKIDKNKNVCTVNGATATNTASTSKSAYPLFLFAVNTAGTASLFGKFKLPETEIYDGETLAIHYVPCYRKADGVAGVYDMITNTFTTSPVGLFINGPEVGGSSKEPIVFTYSGYYIDNRIDDKGVVRLNTSGVFEVVSGTAVVSVFIQGAGGGGVYSTANNRASASGGGGGYQTFMINLIPGTYEIIVGTGGNGVTISTLNKVVAGNGGDTTAFDVTSTGGEGAVGGTTSTAEGGAGGTPNGGDGSTGTASSVGVAGGAPNGGNAGENGGDGYVEITFI